MVSMVGRDGSPGHFGDLGTHGWGRPRPCPAVPEVGRGATKNFCRLSFSCPPLWSLAVYIHTLLASHRSLEACVIGFGSPGSGQRDVLAGMYRAIDPLGMLLA